MGHQAGRSSRCDGTSRRGEPLRAIHRQLRPPVPDRRELRETGADPANLVFEITETALMGDIEKGEAFAHGLAGLGCGLALDDFGTGFGSFTYLKALPIGYLKIDVEFVRDLISSPPNQHLVKAIVSLARSFGHRRSPKE